MHRVLDCIPADVSATQLGVSWNGELPAVLAERLIDAPGHPSSLHLAVIGGSHVVTVDAPSGQFREEISCDAPQAAGACWPLPEDVDEGGYRLLTRTRAFSPDAFETAGDAIAAGGGDWLIATFPGVGRHHLTALKGEFVAGEWRWWTHHLYPGELTIVSTRSTYRP
ncbi:hypothetical protein COCCU_12160 [Corynebacterium occultum]|uniref:DUF2617 domain-containing protein n=1 Tax=Corynebacterium occultum TaxID=2675219 RepID=A0A6B8VRY1_9CORY|nr:DUF2617 family protein [Corynebacterium occultum]QGU08332.1 hypothetical protein COCCU_12160 [Corynebacterium occultum]